MASTIDIPTIKLRNGTAVPIRGYGTGTAWFKKSQDTEINRILIDRAKDANELGYTHLDGAEGYLIHVPFSSTTERQLQTAWAAMEQVQAARKARSIGVSNFLQSHQETILKTTKVIPPVNQIEFHPYLQHGDLVPWQESQGIQTVGYGGLVPITRARGGPLDSLLSALATKYGVSESEILLRTLDRGSVAITTSSKESRLSSYLRALVFTLTPQEVTEVSQLGQQNHFRAFWQEYFSANDRS